MTQIICLKGQLKIRCIPFEKTLKNTFKYWKVFFVNVTLTFFK